MWTRAKLRRLFSLIFSAKADTRGTLSDACPFARARSGVLVAMPETSGQLRTRHKLELRVGRQLPLHPRLHVSRQCVRALTPHVSRTQAFEKEFKAKLKAAKGKDKKRAVKEEKKRAEAEIKERHEKEVRAAAGGDSGGDAPVDGDAKAAPEPRGDDVKDGSVKAGTNGKEAKALSRSEKRRRKKAAKEKRQREAAEAAAAQMTDYKQIELDRLAEKLTPLGLTLHAVAADGNCLFRSCEHQIALVDGESSAPDHKELRRQTAQLLASRPDDYRPYLLKDDGCLMNQEEFAAYCKKMGSSSAWGGQAEIAALCELLGRQITVYAAFSKDLVMGKPTEKIPLRIAYHKHYYALGSVSIFPPFCEV